MTRRAGSARRYAQALFDVALGRDTVDAWAAQVHRVAALFEDRVAALVLSSPTATLETKRRVVEAVAGPLSREVASLVDILLQRRRAHLLGSLAGAFSDCVREHRGIAYAEVTTAVPIAEAEQRLLEERLSRYFGRVVEVQSQVDPHIIGGVVARVGDRLVDDSVRGRLQRLRKQLGVPTGG